jgi:SprA-related family
MVVETSGIPSYFNWAMVNATDTTLNSKKTLSSAETEQVKQLKALDKQVRDHEQEHLRAGGALVRSGGASYEYNIGPDGRLYAARGGVEIDSAPVKGDPNSTVDKAEKVRKTALANGLDASLQDRRVAAGAEHMERNAFAQVDALKATRAQFSQAKQAYGRENLSSPSAVNIIS